MNGVNKTTLTLIKIIVVIMLLHIYVVCCKPLQQHSNDRTVPDYDQQQQQLNQRKDNRDNLDGAESEMIVGDFGDDDDMTVSISSSRSSSALDTLKKATEAVNEFRQMLNERLLITASNGNDKTPTTSENFKYSGALPSSASSGGGGVIGYSSSTTFNNNNDKRSDQQHTITNSNSRRKHRHKTHRKQQQNQQQLQQLYQRDKEPVETVLDSTSFSSNDDDTVRDSLAQAFKINANLYRSPDENSQTLLATGRETEARFNLATGLFASPLECPRMHGKVTQLLCPSRRRHGYHVCIDETALCNGKTECPNGEDEDSVNCMFYKTTMRYFKTVVDQVVQLSDHILHNRRRTNEEL